MKVLIVDDDPDVRAFLVSYTEAMGCDQIDVAEMGEEAFPGLFRRDTI